eukprot:gene11781-13001_t
MQDPNADTEWNDALRKHGILPKKKEVEITEDQIENMIDDVVKQKTEGKQLHDMNLDELAEMEDDEDDRILEQIRQQRLQEMKQRQEASKFGGIREISADEYVEQVNNAGEGVWINHYIYNLAKKFPETKFLKSVSTNCIQNYPDKNLPTIFVYCDGQLKAQFVGPHAFAGMDLKQDGKGLEWILAQTGAFVTKLESDPRKKYDTKGEMTILTRDRRGARDSDSDSDLDDD